ncbi:MAG TPA: TonB-dependent receptor [Polyangia bacterium]|nr:TonB-dependent receptor [Polyangia bacterium]
MLKTTFALLSLLAAAPALAQDPPSPATAAPAPVEPKDTEYPYETVVTATTPVHGSGLPKDHIAANVRSISAADLADHKSADLSGFMGESTGSVHINDVQGNPLQPDLQYRGFLASPLLGAPQGLSMYVDGVRLNEPFGDTINWDLIPTNAISSVNVIPGSNPIFGLNTLGGALSLETKTGFSDPDANGTVLYGSWNRKLVRADAGAHGETFGIFAAAQVFDEDGWRAASPTRAAQAFLSGSYRHQGSSLDLSLMGASTSLTGNGAAPEQLLTQDRRAVFTTPDRTENQMFMATLRGDRPLAEHVRLSGTAFVRTNRTRSVNGDQHDWSQCTAMPGVLCSVDDAGNETPVLDKAGAPVPFDDAYDAAENRTNTRQTSYGVGLQLAVDAPLAARENHLFVGAEADQGRITFRSSSTVGSLDSRRDTVDTGFLDPASPIAVDSTVNDLGAYATDTFSIRRDLFVTASARFNLTKLSLEDRIGDDLTGDHTFNRVNPALGLSYQPRRWLGVYASYSESNRAPTAVELTCASPMDPCRLPNAFAADPPLAQVVARTFEAGVRGSVRPGIASYTYDLTAFRTVSSDDILFITSGTVANQGYFANVGQTRRQGLEADLSGRIRLGGSRIDWNVDYTYLDATFETPFTALSATHPDADANGQVQVPAGAHLPSVPKHIVKVGLGYLAPFGLSAGVNVVGNSSQYFRGDEANLLDPIPGYVVVNARAAYRFWSHGSVFVLADNLGNAKYSTFGVLGDATDVLGPTYNSPKFLGPGAPRAGWAGLDFNY